MSRVFTLSMTLIDPVVLSRAAITVGGHDSLDHVPGSALLGAAAARLYRDLSPEDAWTLFHSGRVRFGNGYPMTAEGAIALPVPLSWHYPKAAGLPATRAARLAGLTDLSATGAKTATQPEQLRGRYILREGDWLDVPRHRVLRTAIDPRSGTAREGALFSYEAIAAGSRFCAMIAVDDAVPAALVKQLGAVFGVGELRLGRSRAAEYGRVATAWAAQGKPFSAHSEAVDQAVRVYCLSDLALIDACGGPAQEIDGTDLGLPGFSIDWGACHVRHRRYSPFNAALRLYDSERQVIEKGSVLVLRGKGKRRSGLAVVGAWREAGLGQLWFDPPFLGRATIRPGKSWRAPRAALPSTDGVEDRAAVPGFKGLLAWRTGDGAEKDRVWAMTKAEEIRRLYQTAAALLRGDPEAPVGPRSSQWTRIAAAAEAATDMKALGARVAEVITRTARPGAPEDFDWRLTTLANERYQTFGEWLTSQVENSDATPRRIAELARIGAKIAKQREAR